LPSAELGREVELGERAEFPAPGGVEIEDVQEGLLRESDVNASVIGLESCEEGGGDLIMEWW
jgi:hypothetical protein